MELLFELKAVAKKQAFFFDQLKETNKILYMWMAHKLSQFIHLSTQNCNCIYSIAKNNKTNSSLHTKERYLYFAQIQDHSLCAAEISSHYDRSNWDYKYNF